MLHISAKMGLRTHFKDKVMEELSHMMVFHVVPGVESSCLASWFVILSHIPHHDTSPLYLLSICRTQEVTGVLSNYYNIKIHVMWHSE